MSTGIDDSPTRVFSTPKGGLFAGPFDPSGLDANVRALIMDFRLTTAFGGAQPASTISYFFPQQASDYTSVAGYASGSGNLVL